MKQMLRKLWVVLSMILVSTSGTLCVYATEQGPEQAGAASDLFTIMDVLQKVCIGIVIAVVVVIFCFYVAKLVLKKLHVPPEEKQPDEDQQ